MKLRLTTWGNASQFVAHRGEDRMLFDYRSFTDEAACLAAAREWIEGRSPSFDIERRYHLVRLGVFAVYEPRWMGMEVACG